MVKNGLSVKVETIHRQVSPWSVSGPTLQHRRFEDLIETLWNIGGFWRATSCRLANG